MYEPDVCFIRLLMRDFADGTQILSLYQENEEEQERQVSMATSNGVMMQYFHWYTPDDGNLWKQLAKKC